MRTRWWRCEDEKLGGGGGVGGVGASGTPLSIFFFFFAGLGEGIKVASTVFCFWRVGGWGLSRARCRWYSHAFLMGRDEGSRRARTMVFFDQLWRVCVFLQCPMPVYSTLSKRGCGASALHLFYDQPSAVDCTAAQSPRYQLLQAAMVRLPHG